MQAMDAIRNTIQTSQMVIDAYIGDLEDAELLVRPVPGMNHTAWQLGHLIAAERHFVELIRPGSCPPLPDGFEKTHDRENSKLDDPSNFLPRRTCQELWATQREATRSLLDSLTGTDLDRIDPKFPPFAPSVGALLNLCGTHPLMHAGQFVAVRRLLNKPVSI